MKKTFIIAELSGNHNNDFDLAAKSIISIANSGADAVKLQTYKPESLTMNLRNGHFAPIKDGLWKGYTPWELYKKAAMPYEWQAKLKKICKDNDLIFFSSPFDREGVDFLEKLEVPIYKIASPEITDIGLIKYCASKKKPIIISTGLAEIGDIKLAIKSCREVNNQDITLLKCTSDYPAKIRDANLLTIPNMKKKFNVKVGVSDHTIGSIVPVVSVALGATVVEKHFILDKKLGGVDSAFSMEPKEFKYMVKKIRDVELSLGNIKYSISPKKKLKRRSLFVVKNLKKGEKISSKNIKSIRPGCGMHPKYYLEIMNKTVKHSIKKGTPVSWNIFFKKKV